MNNPSPERQQRPLPPARVDTSFYPPNTHVSAGPSSPPWAASPQPQAAQLYPIQNNATQPPQVGSVTGYPPGFGQEDIIAPVPAATAAAVEVAIRYLEAANKAINICIDLNAM